VRHLNTPAVHSNLVSQRRLFEPVAFNSPRLTSQTDPKLRSSGFSCTYPMDLIPKGPPPNLPRSRYFTLEGTAVPDKVLVTIVAPGSSTPYCKVVSGAGTYTVLGNEVRADCNASVPGALLPVGEIEAVQWIVPSNDGAVPFNFCVSNLSVVTF